MRFFFVFITLPDFFLYRSIFKVGDLQAAQCANIAFVNTEAGSKNRADSNCASVEVFVGVKVDMLSEHRAEDERKGNQRGERGKTVS